VRGARRATHLVFEPCHLEQQRRIAGERVGTLKSGEGGSWATRLQRALRLFRERPGLGHRAIRRDGSLMWQRVRRRGAVPGGQKRQASE
jgi:hypothetical protein